MDINIVFKIGSIGILVAVISQVLSRSGREDQALMAGLAGLIIVVLMVIKELDYLFDTIKYTFGL